MTSIPPLRPLDCSDKNYRIIRAQFYGSWEHPEKTAKIMAIYMADEDELAESYRGRRFHKYIHKYGGDCDMLFHGTRRTCRIGNDDRGDLEPCEDRKCSLCCILRDSFSVRKACSDGRFGAGIYTTNVSSKADLYVKNHHLMSRKHAMLVCGVSTNRPQYLTGAEYRASPDPGYDCVKALTFDQGGSVKYPETIVYADDAIVPVALIIYTRGGWDGYY